MKLTSFFRVYTFQLSERERLIVEDLDLHG